MSEDNVDSECGETPSISNSENQGAVNKKEKAEKERVELILKATGNAPILRKKSWKVDGDQTIGWVSNFIRRYLKMEPQEHVFLYVNQTFAPPPDVAIKYLFDCYSTEGKLILHYCKTQAWG